jgi:hypothetical protein
MPKSNGVTATAVGTQIAKEATQQAVANQSNAEAGRDVVITETELEATGETVNIDQSIPPWVLIALVLGWLAPSPSEMGRGLLAMIASLRRPNGQQRFDGDSTQNARREPTVAHPRP